MPTGISATFNNDGTKVVFTDEWGGGGRPRCRAWDPLNWGADAIYDIVDNKLVFKSHYKMPAPQLESENCVAHNGSIVPVKGRDIFAQAWYQGGISIMDFTDSANPIEIGYFDRGPVLEDELVTGGYWSVYYYEGKLYGTEDCKSLMYLNYFQVSSFQRRILSQPKMQDLLQGLKDYLILNSKYRWSGQIILHLNNLEKTSRSQAKPFIKLEEFCLETYFLIPGLSKFLLFENNLEIVILREVPFPIFSLLLIGALQVIFGTLIIVGKKVSISACILVFITSLINLYIHDFGT